VHEISLAEEILRMIEESSVSEGFNKVKSLTLEMGQLAGVDPEALSFALTHMAPGSLIDGAIIHLDELPGSGYCSSCKKRVAIDFRLAPCPQCGQQPLSTIEGTELRVRHLEVN
jgi:hydrogenase nickel incorporation protein HypA/HybF